MEAIPFARRKTRKSVQLTRATMSTPDVLLAGQVGRLVWLGSPGESRAAQNSPIHSMHCGCVGCSFEQGASDNRAGNGGQALVRYSKPLNLLG